MDPKTTACIHMLNAKLRALTELMSDRLGADDRRLFSAELRIKLADNCNDEFVELNSFNPEAAKIFNEMRLLATDELGRGTE